MQFLEEDGTGAGVRFAFHDGTELGGWMGIKAVFWLTAAQGGIA